MLHGGWFRVVRAVVCALVCAGAIAVWAAPPAKADVVTWGLGRVKHDQLNLERSEKHLREARRHHYHVVGLHRWYLKHLTVLKVMRQADLARSPFPLTKLTARINHTQWKIKRWGKIRLRLERKVAFRRARLIGMSAWVHSVIAAQAAAESRRANLILHQLSHDKKHPGQAISGNSVDVRAVRAALTQLGVPYVWGGETPGKGFDCSGLTQWAYAQVGISLVHFAATQATEGTPVSLSDLEPGDLVFFENPIGHVAMYIGDGLLIEAPETGDVVRITRLDDSWHVANYQMAVRPG